MTIHTTTNYGIAYADVDTPLGDYPTVTQQVANSLDAAMGRAGYTPPDASSFAAEVAARVAGDNALKVLQGTEAAIKTTTTGRTVGDRAFATDTKAVGVWDGTRWLFTDTAWQTYTPTVDFAGVAFTLGASVLQGRYFRKGREISLDFLFQLGTGVSFTTAGVVNIGCPPGYRPALTVGTSSTLGTYCGSGRASGASGVVVGTVATTPNATASQRRLNVVNAADLAVSSSGGPTAINSVGHYVQGRCTYNTEFEA